MAEPIYKLWMMRYKEAWYQLSEEEQNSQLAKAVEALDKAGGKSVLTCTSLWSSERWMAFGVEEYPDIEAARKHTELLFELEHYRYFESVSYLGIKWPPS